MALNLDGLPSDGTQFTAYLSELSEQQLDRLEPALVDHFRTIRASSGDSPTEDAMGRLKLLTSQIGLVRAEKSRRKELTAQTAAETTAQAHRQALADLEAVVTGEVLPAAAPTADDPQVSTAVASMANVFANAIEQAVARISGGAITAPAGLFSARPINNHLRTSLGQMARNAPDPKVAPLRTEAVLVATADVPGRARIGTLDGIGDLAKLVSERARMLTVTRGNPNYVPVAYLKRDFRYRLGLDSTPEEINEVLQAATDVEALIAAGGWCSPSEISYDFFNIVCEDGMVDIPTVGVLNRGGMRFPLSPTIADIFADPNVLWSWTEQQDEDAANGATGADTKTCARVPCSDFDEVRAACDGLCVTAGNLIDFAYPEAIENYLRLVMAGRAHRTNNLIITQLRNASTAVDMSSSPEGAAASLLNSADLQATDYRERYRMCEDAVVEAVFARGASRGTIRADLANRNGLAMFEVTNAMIADWFDIRAIRAQFVADYQAGFAGSPIGSPTVIATDWPDTTEYLLYAPGTFVRGQGLQLDLGVVRDSTLNETNDHTAAWMEDCYAVAMVGHESRRVTASTCTAGPTGAAELSCATFS